LKDLPGINSSLLLTLENYGNIKGLTTLVWSNICDIGQEPTIKSKLKAYSQILTNFRIVATLGMRTMFAEMCLLTDDHCANDLSYVCYRKDWSKLAERMRERERERVRERERQSVAMKGLRHGC
jgi:hypothetical protein